MKRNAMASLETWAASRNRKPLVVNGARQVGKTWLVREFGKEHFESIAYVNFLENETMQSVFAGSLEPARLLAAIGAYTGARTSDGSTLVFLDEIQECPRAITSLKMLCEQRPDVPVIAAGSLLGVAMSAGRDGASWPVGKVSYLDLHPMTFVEFLRALGDDQMANLVRADSLELIDAMSERYNDRLREYLFVGGMPEAVREFAATHDPLAARAVQERLLRDYEHDFSKHVDSPTETERIRETWRSVPAQISRESGTNKFVYSQVKQGGRGRDYKDAVSWLVDAGLVTRVSRVTRPGVPLGSYVDDRSFKLFMLDVGLLGAALRLDERTIVEGDRLFTHAKGAYAEQYVCQQLVASNACTPYYWSADGRQSKAEVDLIYDYKGAVVPVEVKADENVRSSSLGRFARENGIARSVRLSLRGHVDQGWLVNIPLAAADILPVVP
jgi:predicted AAA+ superfamily ATPase